MADSKIKYFSTNDPLQEWLNKQQQFSWLPKKLKKVSVDMPDRKSVVSYVATDTPVGQQTIVAATPNESIEEDGQTISLNDSYPEMEVTPVLTFDPERRSGSVTYKVSSIDSGHMQDVLDEFQKAGLDVIVTSGVRPEGDKFSWHSKGNAIDITPKDKSTKGFQDFITKLRNSPKLINFLKERGLGILRETNRTALNRTGGTGIHFHIGPDINARKDLELIIKGEYPILGYSNKNDKFLGKQGGTLPPEIPIGKSGIHINPKNKGKFNALKRRTGKTTEELTHSKNPLTRKRAIFAQNAKKWNHKKK